MTVSEIAAAGLPAIFVPFMHKDRQQYWNARPLEEAGAAKIIEQPQFNADVVAELLASWDRKTLLAMAESARGRHSGCHRARGGGAGAARQVTSAGVRCAEPE